MPPRKLDPALEQVLRSAVFDDSRPGPVLHDLQVVLDYIGTEGVKAGGQYNLLPLPCIPVLNPRLRRSMDLDLERPQLRSHPYLQGLHLLLRASGLVLVQGMGKTARLMPNTEVLASWQQLTAIERYFTLLEAWLVRGRDEMIGERPRIYDEGFLRNAVGLFARARHWSASDAASVEVQLAVGYHGWHNLALMDLFGLVTLASPLRELMRTVLSRTVSPGRAVPTPFGTALMTLLAEEDKDFPILAEEVEEAVADQEEDTTAPVTFGILYPWFQPWFPELQHTLEFPTEDGPHEGVYVFKMTLWKDVWRILALNHDHTLHDLVNLVLQSLNFDDDHLYEFTWRDPLGRTARAVHPYMDDGTPADDVELGSLPLRPGEVLQMHYDFGDDWRFELKLERIDPPGSMKKLPKILEKKGKSPPQYSNLEDWD
jgi:hypothetical protein